MDLLTKFGELVDANYIPFFIGGAVVWCGAFAMNIYNKRQDRKKKGQ